MRNILKNTLFTLSLASIGLVGCVASNDSLRENNEGFTAMPDEPVCADCELKEAIAAKKGQIEEKTALLNADRSSIKGLSDYNEALRASIKDYDKKIDVLKNSKMQGFKFALEGALAVLEVESLFGLVKNVKCLKPTSKTPIIVNGVKVAGPDILKFGLALKDPKKMKMFLAKATIKGTLSAANDADQTWIEMAVGYIPLTSAMKLPQRWNEWINAGDLIAVIEDAKVKVEADIATNEKSIAILEKVIPPTEKRIEQLKEELKKLEEELANGGTCSVDDTTDDQTVIQPVVTGLIHVALDMALTPDAPSEPTGPSPDGEPTTPTIPTTCGDLGEVDYIDYSDTSDGTGDCTGAGTEPPTTPPPSGGDNTVFPWGQTF